MFNLYPDYSVYARSSQQGEDFGDALLPNGLTVDVKSTQYESGRLLAAKWKNPNVDLYALMTGTFPTYTFRGFMRSEELLRKSRLADLGHGEGFVAEQAELRTLDELFPPKPPEPTPPPRRGRGRPPKPKDTPVMDTLEMFGTTELP